MSFRVEVIDAMKKGDIYGFADDLRGLYIKLSCNCPRAASSIEKLFIKVAQVSEANFASWLEKHNRDKKRIGLQDLRNYDGLLALYRMRAQFSGMPDMQQFFEVIRDDMGLIVAIHGFAQFIGDSEVGELLSPVQSIILMINEKYKIPDVVSNPIAVKEDLKRIKEAYLASSTTNKKSDNKALTKKQKKTVVFTRLFRKFSEDIGRAAANLGKKELSRRISEDGILMYPGVMKQYLGDAGINDDLTYKSSTIRDMLKYINKNLDEEDFDGLYEYIKHTILLFAGLTSPRNDYESFGPSESGLDFSVFLGTPQNIEKPKEQVVFTGTTVDDEKWLNPTVLGMVNGLLGSLFVSL